MSDYNLNIDPEFKRLLPELQPEEFQRLEESILEEGCRDPRDPIVIWDNTIVDGHNRYSICQKHGIPFSTTSLVFSRREEAIRWICLNQMGRRNISAELLRYQIGKRYNMEKLLSSTHNPKGKNQYSEVPSEDMMQPPGNYMGTAARIGREYNVSHFAVHTYKDIARAVDKIAEKDDRLSEHYLNGRIRIKKDDLVTISEMGKNQVHALTNSLIRQEKTSCRTLERVQDYFQWRQEDAHRNSLNSHCYWLLRSQGKSVTEATSMLSGKSVAFKNELLFQNGINYDKLPAWQKRGVGVYWKTIEKQGFNPVSGQSETAVRRSLFVDEALPLREEYSAFITRLLEEQK